jgi:hypothetical protein
MKGFVLVWLVGSMALTGVLILWGIIKAAEIRRRTQVSRRRLRRLAPSKRRGDAGGQSPVVEVTERKPHDGAFPFCGQCDRSKGLSVCHNH